jgi:integrase
MEFTANNLKTLALPPGAKDKTFWDDTLPAFGLRLRSSGSESWVVQYDIAGKTRRVTLGTPALLTAGAARAKAKDLLAKIRLGGDPAAEKREARVKAAETFGAILPRYLAKQQRECRPRSYTEIARHLEKYAKPLHPRSLSSIDRRQVSTLIGNITVRSGPSAAINLHGSLAGFFSWAMREGLIDANPTIHANRPKDPPSRDRVPSEGELRALWGALGDDGDDYADIVRLIVLTATRRNEIGDLHWDELDLDAATIDIPAARMKNSKPHLIPLSEPALAILRKRQRTRQDYVFGQGGAAGFNGWAKRRKALDARIGDPRPDWVLHDLRRLASTVMHEKLGVQPHIVERILAHVGHQSGIGGVYNKSEYIVEKRRALERWADWVKDRQVSVRSKRNPSTNRRFEMTSISERRFELDDCAGRQSRQPDPAD